MALRVMQIFVPQESGKTPDELLEGRDVLGRWHDEHKGQTVLHLLVPAEETEPIMDQFEQHFACESERAKSSTIKATVTWTILLGLLLLILWLNSMGVTP